jgi:hypothetical protein
MMSTTCFLRCRLLLGSLVVLCASAACVEGEDALRRRDSGQALDAADEGPIDTFAPPTDTFVPPVDTFVEDTFRPNDVVSDRCMPREICNNRDDTCDGVVDEGCPRGVAVSMPPRFGTLSRGSMTGNQAQAIAGRNQVLVGFFGRKGGVINSLGSLVSELTVVVNTQQEPYSFVVRTLPASELPAYGGGGGSGFREQCPDDTILTSLRVQNRNGCTSPGICYEVIGDLVGDCSQVQLRLEGSMWTVTLVPMSTLMVLGSDAPRGMYVAPPGPYAGLWLRTGAFVDELSIGQTDLRLELR